MENGMEDPQKNQKQNHHMYAPAILHLGIYTKEMKTPTQKHICTPMCRVALFTVAKAWKQPKCATDG